MMKKLLALFLALLMTASLAAIPASAEEFTDDGDIAYQEAVDVMLAVDVISGYENGSFKPTGSLTRGAAAKIICNMVLGPTTAGALVADSAPFADVPASHTFAPYIAYVAAEGIVNGYADGSFRPAGTLTGYAFMKMLLGALGYDAAIEGYVGDNWSINVAKQGLSLDLTEGLDGEFEGNEMINRQTAMLLAFNAMQAEMVKYDDKSTISVGDITVNNQSDAKGTGMTFMQMYFSDLEKTENLHDPLGRPATRWALDGKEIGLYAKAYDNFYLNIVTAKELYAELGLTDTLPAANIDYYVDGVLGATGNRTFTDIAKKGTGGAGEQGVLTEIYWDHDAQKLTVVEINSYIGDIINVKKDEEGRYVTVSGLDFRAFNGDFYTEEFDFGDRVIYYVNQQDGEIVEMELANTAVVDVTKVVSTGKFVASAKIWTNHRELASQTPKMINNGGDHPERPISVGKTVKVWMNHYNYVVWAEELGGLSGRGVVLEIGQETDTYGGISYWAKVLWEDASVEEVQIVGYKDTSTAVKDITAGTINDVKKRFEGNLATIKKAASSSEYTLDLLSVAKSGEVEITNGVSKMTVRNVERYANNSTTFLVQTGTAKEPVYNVHTGYKNVPNIKGEAVSGLVYCPIGSTVAEVVYVKDVQVSGGANDYIYIHGAGTAAKVTDTNGDVWPYPAVIDGKVTTVNVDATMNGNQLYTELSYDKNGAVELDTSALYLYNTDNSEDEYAMKAIVTEEFEADVIELDGEGYAVADGVDVWCVTDNSGLGTADTIAAGSIKQVEQGAAVRAIIVNGEVVVLIYCVDAANNKQTVTTPDSDDTTQPPTSGGSEAYNMTLNALERIPTDRTNLMVKVEAPVDIKKNGILKESLVTVKDEAGNVVAKLNDEELKWEGRTVRQGNDLGLTVPIIQSGYDSTMLGGDYVVSVSFKYGDVSYSGSATLNLTKTSSYVPLPEGGGSSSVVYEADPFTPPTESAGTLTLVDAVYRSDLSLDRKETDSSDSTKQKVVESYKGAVIVSVANPVGAVIPADGNWNTSVLWDVETGEVVGHSAQAINGTKYGKTWQEAFLKENVTRPETTETGNYVFLIYFEPGYDYSSALGNIYRMRLALKLQLKDEGGNLLPAEWYTLVTEVEIT